MFFKSLSILLQSLLSGLETPGIIAGFIYVVPDGTCSVIIELVALWEKSWIALV